MARVIPGRRTITALLLALLMIIGVITACSDTLLLGRVRELVLTGQWDDGIWDESIFAE